MNAQLLFTHALTPLQAGTGQGVGVIDLPIARETATGIPYLPGSSLKGVLREQCRELGSAKEHLIPIFGPKTDNADAHAGAVQFSDQRLLLFPVRVLKGTFAWVTCPHVLARFARDCRVVNITDCPTEPNFEGEQSAQVTSENVLTLTHQNRSLVVLEDLDLERQESDDAQKWAEWLGQKIFTDGNWQTTLKQRFCIVHDDVFAFLLETATQITARIRLQDQTKTVKDGGLWYEEALPAESVLYGLVVATPVKKTKLEAEEILETVRQLTEATVQLGGSATVGRGLCQLTMLSEENNGNA